MRASAGDRGERIAASRGHAREEQQRAAQPGLRQGLTRRVTENTLRHAWKYMQLISDKFIIQI